MTTGGLYVIEDTVGAVEIYDAYGTVVEILETVTEVVEIVTPELVGPEGPPGIQGVDGQPGPQGAIGPQGPFAPTFRMEFASPIDMWVINHNLDVYPVVDLYDFDGSEIGGDITMPDKNTVVVTFDFPVSGFAVLKA
jgi:hypothetical protein